MIPIMIPIHFDDTVYTAYWPKNINLSLIPLNLVHLKINTRIRINTQGKVHSTLNSDISIIYLWIVGY